MKRIIACCLCALCLLLCACTPQPAGPAASAQSPTATITATAAAAVTPQITEGSLDSVPGRLNFNVRNDFKISSDSMEENRYYLCYRDDGSGVNHVEDSGCWFYRNTKTGRDFNPADSDAQWVEERQLPQRHNGVLPVISRDGARRGVFIPFEGEIYWPQTEPHESLVDVYQEGESITLWLVSCTSPEADRVEVTGFYDNQYFSCRIYDEAGTLMGTAWYTGRYGRLLYFVPRQLSESMLYADSFYAGNGWICVCNHGIREGNWMVQTSGVRFINLENQEVREREDIEQITVGTWYRRQESPIRYRDHDGRYGYVNENGQNAINELFAEVDPMLTMASVKPLDSNGMVFIDHHGNRLLQGQEFEWAYFSPYGRLIAAKDHHYTYYDRDGKPLEWASQIPCEDLYGLLGEPGGRECRLEFDFRPLLQQEAYVSLDLAQNCVVYLEPITGEELFRFTVPPAA